MATTISPEKKRVLIVDDHEATRRLIRAVNLPDMDGFAVCRALRTVHDDIPIVFLSAQSDMASFHEFVAAGSGEP